jgi:hypothetical protein
MAITANIEWRPEIRRPARRGYYLVSDGTRVNIAKYKPVLRKWMFQNYKMVFEVKYWASLPLAPVQAIEVANG